MATYITKDIRKAIDTNDKSYLNKALFPLFRESHPDYRIGVSDSSIYREWIAEFIASHKAEETPAVVASEPKAKPNTKSNSKSRKGNGKTKSKAKTETKKEIAKAEPKAKTPKKTEQTVANVDIRLEMLKAFCNGSISQDELANGLAKLG